MSASAAVIRTAHTNPVQQPAQLAQPAAAAAVAGEKGVHTQKMAVVAAPTPKLMQVRQKRPLSPSIRGSDEPPGDPRVHLTAELPQREANPVLLQPHASNLNLAVSAAFPPKPHDVASPGAAIATTICAVHVGVDPASAVFASQQLIDMRCFALAQVRMVESAQWYQGEKHTQSDEIKIYTREIGVDVAFHESTSVSSDTYKQTSTAHMHRALTMQQTERIFRLENHDSMMMIVYQWSSKDHPGLDTYDVRNITFPSGVTDVHPCVSKGCSCQGLRLQGDKEPAWFDILID